MKIKGIPYIFQVTVSKDNETATGIRPSLIIESHCGNYKGALIAGFAAGTDKEKGAGNLDGLCVGGLFSIIDGSSKGVNVGGLANVVKEDSKGVGVGGIVNYVKENLSGISLSGAISVVKGRLEGFSYASLMNHAKTNGDLAIQVGMINNISKYDDTGAVVQIGLYNRAGEQTMPLVNIRGIKNLKESKK